MESQCQNLTRAQRNELIKLLKKLEELFNESLGIWKTDPVDFELKENTKPIFSQPYPVSKVHEEIYKKYVERFCPTRSL